MKTCTKCKVDKQFDEFYKSKSSKTGLQAWCKTCASENSKNDYRVNHRKKLFIERAKDRKQRIVSIVNSIKVDRGCVFCGEVVACCLDFHHVNPKVKEDDISLLVHQKSYKRLVEELKKCVVVCANCHRKIHAGLISKEAVEEKYAGIAQLAEQEAFNFEVAGSMPAAGT